MRCTCVESLKSAASPVLLKGKEAPCWMMSGSDVLKFVQVSVSIIIHPGVRGALMKVRVLTSSTPRMTLRANRVSMCWSRWFLKNAVFGGLREDVDIGDFQCADESKIDDPNELRDDERGFGELLQWDALLRGQVFRRHDVELTAVLRECERVPLHQ